MRRAKYEIMRDLLVNILADLDILSGHNVGPSDASWQDVAGTCAVNLTILAGQLAEAIKGHHEVVICFPDPEECLEIARGERIPE